MSVHVQRAHGEGTREVVLFVDDEEAELEAYRLHFEGWFPIRTAKNAQEALEILTREDVLLVVSDERMPGMTGIELLGHVAARWPAVSRIIVSTYSDAARLLAAINRGCANEYVVKPFDPEELRACIERGIATARRARALVAQAGRTAAQEEAARSGFETANIVGADGGLAATMAVVRRAAASDATLLILGETGTGKELIARFVHEHSARCDGPFVRVNCAALPEGTLESELFGHERGAFTGALATRQGRFELAERGTIFLDEIGDISPRTQVSLLRVLQEREIERVGGHVPIPVDVRVVVATHHDLRKLVADGRFREDLFYRLNVVPITLPPLRERREDIGPLVMRFAQKYARDRHVEVAPEVIAALSRYDWPGNVRELENLVHRAIVMSTGDVLTMDDFPLQLLSPEATTERDRVKSNECEKIRQVLIAHGFNCTRAAKAAGVPRTTLAGRARKYGLL
jgi:DNA-binding NtrC family response regulator